MYEARQSLGFSREPRSRVIASDCFFHAVLLHFSPKQVSENQDDETHLNWLAYLLLPVCTSSFRVEVLISYFLVISFPVSA